MDLVIVLGGDGTLTSISHIIDSETLVMGSIHIRGMRMLRALLASSWGPMREPSNRISMPSSMGRLR